MALACMSGSIPTHACRISDHSTALERTTKSILKSLTDRKASTLKQAPQVRKSSAYAAAATSTSPKMLYASAAAASKKPVKIACTNMATKYDPLKEGNVSDP